MKETILEYLKEKGLDSPVNGPIIDELIYNIELSEVLKADIESEGVVISMETDRGTISKLNPTFSAYQLTLKNIKELSTKLALTVQERSKLKLVKEDETQMEIDFHKQ